jgi:hypothetical protein
VKKARSDRKKRRLYIAVFGMLTLLCAACLTAFSVIGNLLEPQEAAKRFRGESDTRFAQVSVFFPVGEGKTASDVNTFRESVDTAITEASLTAPENGSLWTDAYSAEAEITVTGTKGSAEVTALGVGGDWFAFHPLHLRSGGYISETDLMHDKVVLDEELAWKLFGGFDLAGLTVTIGGEPYIIAGVVSHEDDFASEKAYSGEAGLYMYYDAMNAVSESKISCYEFICAEPISGFTLGVAQTGFPDAVTLQNTGRFSFSSVLGIIRDFGERAMSTAGVSFPYWENAARLAENDAALMLALAFVFGAFPVFCAVFLLIRLIRRLKAKLSVAVPARWEIISDRIRERQRLRLEEKERSR